MEPARSQISFDQNLRRNDDVSSDDGHITEQRLEWLIEANQASDRNRSLFRNDRERLEADLIRRPMNATTVFASFGLMIGMMPPLAIALKSISESMTIRPQHVLFVFLLALSSITTGLVGAALGKRVPATIDRIRQLRLPNQLAALVLTGVLWGAIAGTAGGVFLFLIGALVGAFVGGIVGGMTVPIMAIAYEMLRRGDLMDTKHFLPIAFGITLTVCAFILGL